MSGSRHQKSISFHLLVHYVVTQWLANPQKLSNANRQRAIEDLGHVHIPLTIVLVWGVEGSYRPDLVKVPILGMSGITNSGQPHLFDMIWELRKEKLPKTICFYVKKGPQKPGNYIWQSSSTCIMNGLFHTLSLWWAGHAPGISLIIGIAFSLTSNIPLVQDSLGWRNHTFNLQNSDLNLFSIAVTWTEII